MKARNTSDLWQNFFAWLKLRQQFIRLGGLAILVAAFLIFSPAYLRSRLWNGLQSHRLLACLLLLFTLLMISLVWSQGQKLDSRIFLAINFREQRPAWLDKAMLAFTHIGNGMVSVGIALFLFFDGNRLLAYTFILGTMTLWLMVTFLKFFIHRSRPFLRVTQTRIVGGHAIGQSFPSGHTGQAFFMATLLSTLFQFNIALIILLFIIAAIVGITRMYIGAHYPRDVLGGAILGCAWGLLGVIVVNGYMVSRIG